MQVGITLSVRGVSDEMAIVVGSAVVPPRGSTLAKRYLRIVDAATGVRHLATARCRIANGAPRRHELSHQTIMGILVERGVALPP